MQLHNSSFVIFLWHPQMSIVRQAEKLKSHSNVWLCRFWCDVVCNAVSYTVVMLCVCDVLCDVVCEMIDFKLFGSFGNRWTDRHFYF